MMRWLLVLTLYSPAPGKDTVVVEERRSLHATEAKCEQAGHKQVLAARAENKWGTITAGCRWVPPGSKP